MKNFFSNNKKSIIYEKKSPPLTMPLEAQKILPSLPISAWPVQILLYRLKPPDHHQAPAQCVFHNSCHPYNYFHQNNYARFQQQVPIRLLYDEYYRREGGL